MKNLYTWLLGILILLQSCNINTEIFYHKDSTQTLTMMIDMEELLSQANNKQDKKLDKIPKEWTSFYDLEKKEGKKITTNPDSIQLMKKMFMKRIENNNKVSGFGIKIEKFTIDEIKNISKMDKDFSKEISSGLSLYNWDGKNLTFSTKSLNNNYDTDQSEYEVLSTFKKLKNILKMKTILKFETPIKSINGEHYSIKKLDDYTIEIDYFKEIDNPNQKEASQLSITTE